jgi:hypothetical protein
MLMNYAVLFRRVINYGLFTKIKVKYLKISDNMTNFRWLTSVAVLRFALRCPRIADYRASKGRMIQYDLEATNCGIIETRSRNFHGGAEENC